MSAQTDPDPRTLSEHWDAVYRARATDQLSWFQPVAVPSLAIFDAAGVTPADGVIDVGGGTSTLVDALLERGFADITVLDVSQVALDLARQRLGPAGDIPAWVCTDILSFEPERTYDVWHDRAVFHFLTDAGEQRRYLGIADRAVAEDGAIVLGTFAPDAAPTCSGLQVARHSVEELVSLMGPGFDVVHSAREEHRTPGGTLQPFTWVAWRRAGR